MKFKLMCFAFLFSFFGVSYGVWESSKPFFYCSDKQNVLFDVQKGSSVWEVARSLYAKGASVSPFIFRLIWALKGQPPIKAGHYEVFSAVSLWKLLDILSQGQVHLVRVTIPEGSTLKEIADRLKQAGAIKSSQEFLRWAKDKDFLKGLGLDFALSAEGFLFPDTYIFDRNSQEKKVLCHLVEAFWEELKCIAPCWQNGDKDKLYDKLKLASLVEKECRVSCEAPLIASVFENRLRKGMRLESCATIIYIIKEIEKKEHPERILWQDLALESLYNTYKYKGLPPTPIANCGRTALKAAFEPAKTNYFYFVVKDPNQGTHTFTDNFDKHSQARRAYLESYVVK